jgi:hypothetical protein
VVAGLKVNAAAADFQHSSLFAGGQSTLGFDAAAALTNLSNDFGGGLPGTWVIDDTVGVG